MWMYFSETVVGDPDRGVFLEVRETGDGADFELVHENLLGGTEEAGIRLASGDREALLDVLGDLADDFGADGGFLNVLEAHLANQELSDPLSLEEGWVRVGRDSILNLLNGAVIGLGDVGDGVTVVSYATRFGAQPLFWGDADDASEYHYLLAEFLAASEALGVAQEGPEEPLHA